MIDLKQIIKRIYDKFYKSYYKKQYENLELHLNLSNKHIRPDDIVFENSTKRNKLKQFNL